MNPSVFRHRLRRLEFFDYWLLSVCLGGLVALAVVPALGVGMVTFGLAKLYDRVVTTDKSRKAADEATRHDLDETRRLLYTALLTNERMDVTAMAGTLVNALGHHCGLMSHNEAMDFGRRFASGSNEDGTLQRLIDEISDRLGDRDPADPTQ